MASQKKNPPAKKQPLSKKKKQLIVTVSIIAMAAILLTGVIAVVLTRNNEDYKKLAADRKTVATCNGFKIPYEELRFLATLYKDSLEYTYGEGIWDNPETAEQYRAELESLIMENLNENYLILSACETLSIPTESKEQTEYVNSEMEKLLKTDFNGNKKSMNEWIESQGMTEHYLRFCIGVEYLQSTIYYTLLDMGFYTYDLENITEFMEYVETSPNYARTIHVYVQNDEGDDIEQNRQKAENMYGYLMAEPDAEAREALMREYIGSANNEDFYITKNGYYFTHGEMDKAYEEATFGLAVGDVSQVVETASGFYVIMRLTPDPDYITLNAQTLLSYYQSAAMGAYIETYNEKCTVEFNEYGKGLDLLNLE